MSIVALSLAMAIALYGGSQLDVMRAGLKPNAAIRHEVASLTEPGCGQLERQLRHLAARDWDAGSGLRPRARVCIPEVRNEGLRSARNRTMLALIGKPREDLNDNCQAIGNEKLRRLVVAADVGPFAVTALEPAVHALTRIFAKVKGAHPDIYERLSTPAALCVRNVRGSDRISNHAWGTAIDLSVSGVLDGIQNRAARSDGLTLAALAVLAPYFHEEGWYWGIDFPGFEDGMHFDVSEQLIRRWHAAGLLDSELGPSKPTSGAELQE